MTYETIAVDKRESPDFGEGLKAFLEKRRPVYAGR